MRGRAVEGSFYLCLLDSCCFLTTFLVDFLILYLAIHLNFSVSFIFCSSDRYFEIAMQLIGLCKEISLPNCLVS